MDLHSKPDIVLPPAKVPNRPPSSKYSVKPPNSNAVLNNIDKNKTNAKPEVKKVYPNDKKREEINANLNPNLNKNLNNTNKDKDKDKENMDINKGEYDDTNFNIIIILDKFIDNLIISY
jgi:hypothetical protein